MTDTVVVENGVPSARDLPEASHPVLFHLDLCVLAYQLYNQTLVWPLDPWHEHWSRLGSSRRDNMMAFAHEAVVERRHLRGPGSTRGWRSSNSALDPIVTDYRAVRPWLPCITNDGAASRYYGAAAETTARIRDVVVVEYDTVAGPDGRPDRGDPVVTTIIVNPDPSPGAADRLYAFEGGTGSVDGRPEAWGLLGYVLERDLGGGDYDVHVVFRGSQSGNAVRAALLGFVRESGNPDWVTDMEMIKLIEDDRISPNGRSVRGFRDAVLTSLGTVDHALAEIHASRARAPRQIHVAGHSLGGALAVDFAATMVLGTQEAMSSVDVAAWPWDDLRLYTYGAPKVGDEEFAAHVDAHVDGVRVWADGDPITMFPLHEHVGRDLGLPSDVSGTANHEPAVIRRLLVDNIRSGRIPSPPGVDEAPSDAAPWQNFHDLAGALRAAEADGYAMADLFDAEFAAAAEVYAELAARVISTSSSYSFPFTKPRWKLAARRRRLEQAFAAPVGSLDELDSLVASIGGVQPSSQVEDHLRQVLIVRAAVANRWTPSEVLAVPSLQRALGAPNPAASPVPPGRPSTADRRRVGAIVRMRRRHHASVVESTVKQFRRRQVPVSDMPRLVRACGAYPNTAWAPTALVVPTTLPPESRLPKPYVLRYYGTGKLGWDAYNRSPIRREVAWRPEFEWNDAFPPAPAGWAHPTDDATFARLRTQGPNPWLLRRVADQRSAAVYEVDFSDLLAGVLPPIAARFSHVGDALSSLDITVDGTTHRPGDETWDGAKRLVNAADARFVAFGRHLLGVHLVMGQAFALATYRLPTWHRLRPFMHFFTYGTLEVNDLAYRALLTPNGYFMSSGFLTMEDARKVFQNGIDHFDLDQWIVPRDLETRGIAGMADNAYAEDAALIWPMFSSVVDRHLRDLELDDETIASDAHLQAWYRTLVELLPNVPTPEAGGSALDRDRLAELCTALLWNNVVHEVCGDLSPILGSHDPEDNTIIDIVRLRAAFARGGVAAPVPSATMAGKFLMDQASHVSRFNVGGNRMLAINAAAYVDDPKLRQAIEDLQSSLRRLEHRLQVRNDARPIRAERLLPSNWEASISF